MEIKRNPPIVTQIVEELNKRINTGIYAPGSKLPSESDLANELNVSRASIREALAELDAKGLLWRRHGVGTFVVESGAAISSKLPTFFSLDQYIIQAGYEASMDTRPPVFRPLTEEEKIRLKDEMDGEAVVLYRAYNADKLPVFICEYVIPLIYMKKGQNNVDYFLDIPEFCSKYMLDKVSAIQIRVEPVIANEEITESMRLNKNQPLLKLHNIFFGEKGSPIFLSSLCYNSQKIDFFAFYQIT